MPKPINNEVPQEVPCILEYVWTYDEAYDEEDMQTQYMDEFFEMLFPNCNIYGNMNPISGEELTHYTTGESVEFLVNGEKVDIMNIGEYGVYDNLIDVFYNWVEEERPELYLNWANEIVWFDEDDRNAYYIVVDILDNYGVEYEVFDDYIFRIHEYDFNKISERDRKAICSYNYVCINVVAESDE